VTPSLTTNTALISLTSYVLVYFFFIAFGISYIFKLLLEGPSVEIPAINNATASRPMAFADDAASATGNQLPTRG
jgi:cytochrome bd ubiquinol oxidase subunit I